MAKKPSLAERYRRHREEMLYAMEHDCTPAEARRRIAWEKLKDVLDRREARRAEERLQREARPHEQFNAPWMLRD